VSILNPLFEAVAWVMMQIHAGLSHFFGASSGVTWGLSIVLLVVLMRLIMVPLFIKQRNSMLKMQSHMPQLAELRKKYKNDKQRLNEETMKFYKENGINPLGGCLPLLAQLPVFWSLFNVLKAIADWTPPAPGHAPAQPAYGLTIQVVESARDAKVFGVPLYDTFLRPSVGEGWGPRLIILAFVLVSAGTTFMTMKQSQKRGMLNQTPPDPDQPGAAAAAAMSKNMMYIAPFFALSGLYWQFGLVIYWVTTNIWTLGQQHFLFRRLPVVGSTTVDASAAAASGSSGSAAKSTTVKNAAPRNTAAKSGTSSASSAPKSSTSGAAKTGTAAKAGTAAKTSTAAKTGTKAAEVKPAEKGAASPAPATKAAANGSSNGSSVLKRFGKKEEPQDDIPVAPPTKTVRQQQSRQSRSKRNSGKR
jgi:YidC/Oxa1 family membrane protein insertase